MKVTRRFTIPALAVLAAGVVGLPAVLRSADHIDAPVTTADAPADVNDLFVFRNPADPSRVVIALTMNPLIAPSEAATVRFPTDVLYQWKIDTDGDAVEDLVLQARVVDDGGQQTLVIRGPAPPMTTGTSSRELAMDPIATGRVSGSGETFIIEGSGGVRAFAGVRDDPFYIDLTRLLEVLGGQASSFRNPGDDTLAGLNTLAIVIEMPMSMLGGAQQIGVWATSSRAN